MKILNKLIEGKVVEMGRINNRINSDNDALFSSKDLAKIMEINKQMKEMNNSFVEEFERDFRNDIKNNKILSEFNDYIEPRGELYLPNDKLQAVFYFGGLLEDSIAPYNGTMLYEDRNLGYTYIESNVVEVEEFNEKVDEVMSKLGLPKSSRVIEFRYDGKQTVNDSDFTISSVEEFASLVEGYKSAFKILKPIFLDYIEDILVAVAKGK